MDAIAAADLVVVEDESAIVPELMILGKPIVITTAFEPLGLYSEKDGIAFASDTELVGELQQLLRSAERLTHMLGRYPEALEQLNFGNDGQASTRTADVIVGLAGTARQPLHPQSLTYNSQLRSGPLVGLVQTVGGSSDSQSLRDSQSLLDAQARCLRSQGTDVEIADPSGTLPSGVDVLHVFGPNPGEELR